MKNWKISILALLCCLYLLSGENVHAAQRQDDWETELKQKLLCTEEFLFEDGDVVGFLGDSITHVAYSNISYPEFLYHYYITRYPQWKLEFRNFGMGSYTAGQALALFQGENGVYDPALKGITKAVVMFGMNEALNGMSAEDYIQNIRELVEYINVQGVENQDIILVAPTPFDQTRSSNYLENGTIWQHTDDLLSEYVAELKALSEELDTYYVDLHTPMLQVTEILQKTDKDATLTIDDNIHPRAEGSILAGFFFLYQQGASEEVASVAISETNEVQASNAVVEGVVRRGTSYLRFNYQPGSLPMAVSREFVQAEQYFGMMDEINRESFQIEGMKPDMEYTLYMDQVPVGTFTGGELAQGVNLAACDWNPGQVAAKDIEVLNREWHEKSARYRTVLKDVISETGSHSQEDVDLAYEKWKERTRGLQGEMYEAAQSSVDRVFTVEIVSKSGRIWMKLENWKWAIGGVAAGLMAATGILLIRKIPH